jgi:hypothetical protein
MIPLTTSYSSWNASRRQIYHPSDAAYQAPVRHNDRREDASASAQVEPAWHTRNLCRDGANTETWKEIGVILKKH